MSNWKEARAREAHELSPLVHSSAPRRTRVPNFDPSKGGGDSGSDDEDNDDDVDMKSKSGLSKEKGTKRNGSSRYSKEVEDDDV